MDICCACFGLIQDEEPFRFRPKGRKLHKACAQKEGNYYVRLEMRLAEKEGEKC